MLLAKKKKVALVTGTSSGIGEAVAIRLATMEITVYAAARRLDRMENLKEKGIRVLPLDLTDEKSIEECYRKIEEEAGAINTGWRAIVGESLLRYSGKGPYAKAVHAAHSKFMSPAFDKMLSDPAIIAEVVQEIVTAERPKPVYTAPRMARTLTLVHKMLGSDRLRDAFARRFIGLPKEM